MELRSPRFPQRFTQWIYLGIACLAGLLLVWFFSGQMVIGGVPSSIILRFVEDDVARTAYIAGDRQRIHDRLGELGVEDAIKAYYRPQISDEAELDRYIHQLLYNQTGYVGTAYELGTDNQLVLKQK